MAKTKKMRLASYLISRNLLTAVQAAEILTEQEGHATGLRDRFGRLAVKKGYISEARLNSAVLSWEREQAGY
jgi:hypothetical protein